MRTFSPFWLVMLTLGVISKAFAFGYVAPEGVEKGVLECAGTGLSTFSCARGIERKALLASVKTLNRTGNVLQIRIADKTITFVDTPEKSRAGSVSYSYLTYSQPLNSHILHLQYNEGSAYMVVHHQSGKQASSSGFPFRSPNGKYFLSFSEDMISGFRPNNIEVWQVEQGEFRKIASYDDLPWGPRNGHWTSDHRILVEKWCYDPRSGNLIPCGTAKIVRSGFTWKLEK